MKDPVPQDMSLVVKTIVLGTQLLTGITIGHVAASALEGQNHVMVNVLQAITVVVVFVYPYLTIQSGAVARSVLITKSRAIKPVPL